MNNWYFRCSEPKDAQNFHWWTLHHFWWGLLMIVGSFVLAFEYYFAWYCYLILITGIWFCWDDWEQHRRQAKEIKQYGHYYTVSLLNWWPNKIRDWIKDKWGR